MNGACYVLMGPPGAGKGTQAMRLTERLQAVHLSTGEMLRAIVAGESELGRQIAAILDAGELVEDDAMVQMVRERVAGVEDEQAILFDGFPRTRPQAEALDEILAQEARRLAAALLIEVPHEELIERLLARGRRDDKREVIEERVEIYKRETLPLRTYYAERGLLRVVDGSGTVEQVTQRLLEAIEQQDG
jgi:adenylate kinase